MPNADPMLARHLMSVTYAGPVLGQHLIIFVLVVLMVLCFFNGTMLAQYRVNVTYAAGLETSSLLFFFKLSVLMIHAVGAVGMSPALECPCLRALVN